jgi:phage major head subunit gpT-like protein
MIVNQAALSGIYKSFSTVFSEAFAGAKTLWDIVAMAAPSTGRSVDYKWLGAMPMMREWLGDRVLNDLNAFHYELVNKDYEATVSVDRNDIEDDQIGVYRPMIQGLAAAAAQHPDVLVFSLLKAGFSTTCFDGQYFFDSDHPVGSSSVSNTGGGSGTAWYLLDLSRPIRPLILQRRKAPEFVSLDSAKDNHVFMRKKYLYGVDDRKNVGFGLWQLGYGSKQDLTAANYASARAAMQSFKSDEGTPLGVVPTHVVVPPTLESAARTLLTSQVNASGASNPWYNTAELVVVPWLA